MLSDTTYPVTAAPPFELGANHDTDNPPLLDDTCTARGEFGTAAGVTAAEGSDVGPELYWCAATTVNVYAVPFDSPVTTQASSPEVQVHVEPPGDAVTVYVSIAKPPVSGGATHDTVDRPLSNDVAVTDVGAPGARYGTFCVATEPLDPATLDATTVAV